MDNQQFLNVISNSFKEFLASGTSTSTAKLKPLHGEIAQDIAERLGDGYTVFSQGYGKGKEAIIEGRYINKRVDITIKHNGKPVCGIAVKFAVQNYSQNSNNYFENMLGETANIRSVNCPYFQIFIILDKLPYYDEDKRIRRWETFTDHNVSKYVTLSNDNTDIFFHTPNKTLIYVVHIPDNEKLQTRKEYMEYYKGISPEMELSQHEYENFANAVILNNYECFMDKVYHTIMAL